MIILTKIKHIYQLIEQPRVLRFTQLGLYISMITLGGLFLVDLPESFEGILGDVVSYAFGWLITGGALLGSIGVLPSWWWLERLGIIALWLGLAIYIVVVLVLGGSTIGIAIAIGLAIALLNRWMLEYYHKALWAIL